MSSTSKWYLVEKGGNTWVIIFILKFLGLGFYRMPLYLERGEKHLTQAFLKAIEDSIPEHAPQTQNARKECFMELSKYKDQRVYFGSDTTKTTTRLKNWGNDSLNPRSWFTTNRLPLFSKSTIKRIQGHEDKLSAKPKEGRQDLWTREQLIVVLNLYVNLPFGRMHRLNPEVIRIAGLIGRSANAVAFRLGNYAYVDESLMQKGLENGYRQVEPIWNEFNEDRERLLFLSEQILADLEQQPIEIKYAEDLKDLTHLTGDTKERLVKTRVNQHLFRQIVLTNYESRCAITGINIPSLLAASHILPWASHEKERLLPENGICLSALYDKAFDKGLIGITPDLEVRVSQKLKAYSSEPYYQNHFAAIHGTKLRKAGKYAPKREFLEWHWDELYSR